jgi:hypothetical protein
MTADGLGALHARAREEGADAAYGPTRRIAGLRELGNGKAESREGDRKPPQAAAARLQEFQGCPADESPSATEAPRCFGWPRAIPGAIFGPDAVPASIALARRGVRVAPIHSSLRGLPNRRTGVNFVAGGATFLASYPYLAPKIAKLPGPMVQSVSRLVRQPCRTVGARVRFGENLVVVNHGRSGGQAALRECGNDSGDW